MNLRREYVWKKDTVETLLNDIFYSFEISYTDYADVDITAEDGVDEFDLLELDDQVHASVGANAVGSESAIDEEEKEAK